MAERRIKSIEYSKRFLKSLKRSAEKVIKQDEEKEKIFKENCFNPKLKTHKIKGEKEEVWSFSIT